MFKINFCLTCNFVIKLCLFIMAFVIVISIFDAYYNYINFFDRGVFNSKYSPSLSIALLGTILTSILTLIIALIAWVQLKGIRKTANGDFLMRIDNILHNERILDAINFIYILDRKSKAKCPQHKTRDLNCSECEKIVTKDIQHKLSKIWGSNKPGDMKKRFNIGLYLDYLETLSYFVNVDYISLDDIENLTGGLIKFHGDLFCDWIQLARRGHSNAYSELLELCNKLSNR